MQTIAGFVHVKKLQHKLIIPPDLLVRNITSCSCIPTPGLRLQPSKFFPTVSILLSLLGDAHCI